MAQPKLLAILYKVQLPRLKCQFIIQKKSHDTPPNEEGILCDSFII